MSPFTLALIGETNVNRTNPEEAFHHAAGFLEKANARIGHMETLLSACPSEDPERPDLPYKPLWRFSTPDNARAWKAYNFNAVSLASNISCGDEAIVTTVDTLDALGIGHAGIGRDLSAASAPAVFEVDGVRIGLLSFTSVFWPFLVPARLHSPGAAVLPAQMSVIPDRRTTEMPGAIPAVRTWAPDETKEKLKAAVNALKKQVQILVVSCHWGVSGSNNPCEYQQQLAHVAIDAGADAVMGHHPHKIQGIEVYRGHPVFYSMGNFAFDWFHMKGRNKTGYGVHLIYDGCECPKIRLSMFMRDDEEQVRPLSPACVAGRAVLDEIISLSRSFGTTIQEDGEILVVS